MTVKRMSLRFQLENEEDRRAWERLQALEDSRTKTIISAINAYFDREVDLRDVIRETIRECLKDVSVVQKVEDNSENEISAEEDVLMDSLDLFL